MRELTEYIVEQPMRYLRVDAPVYHTPDGVPYLREAGVVLLGQTASHVQGIRDYLRGLEKTFVTYLDDPIVLNAGAQLSKVAGQLCYQSFDENATKNKDADRYFDNIKKQKHGSVLEHAVYTVLLYGIDRAVTHELVRHRAGTAFCLAGDTLIYSEKKVHGRRQGGTKRPIRDIFQMTKTVHGRSRLKLLKLRVMDESTKTFVTGRVKAVIESGMKPVFRVELADGKTVTCTKEHRFFTAEGEESLESIVGGLQLSVNGKTAVHGQLTRPIYVNGEALYKNSEWLREQYVAKGLEQAQIGQLAGVSEHTIRSWVRKHELQKPMGSWTKGRTPWNKDKRYSTGPFHTAENKERFRQAKLGAKNHRWRGGVTSERVKIAKDVLKMRPEIFDRDYFTCRLCKKAGGALVLHHILPVWSRPDLARDKDNIATVCERCHVDRLNGHELDFVEVLGRLNTEIGTRSPKRGQPTTLRGKLVNIVKITYEGVQMTYDLEMEGPNHNFVANGIVVHNSQVSQRYVSSDRVRFVMQAELQGKPDGESMFFRHVLANRDAYEERTEWLSSQAQAIEGESKRDRRKRVQSGARRALANEAEAPIIVSGNVRTWRHIFTKRCAHAADRAIRAPMIEVFRILKELNPQGFDDFADTTLPDGTRGLIPETEGV